MKKTIETQAIYEDDIKGFMKELGLWKDYKKGRLKCICGKTITDQNLTAFMPINGKSYALCSIFCKKT